MKTTDLKKLKAVPVLSIEDLFRHEVLVGVTFNERGAVVRSGSPYKAIRRVDKNEKGEAEGGIAVKRYNTAMFYDDRYITGINEEELFMNPTEHGVGECKSSASKRTMVMGMNLEDFTRFDDGVVSTLHYEQVENWRKIGERLNNTAQILGLPERATVF